MIEQVGIRELRDNLKDVLERVERGETIEITRNGRTIGMIVPKPEEGESPVARLMAEGKLLPSRSGRETVRLPKRVLPSPGGPSTAEVLDELRADHR